MIETEQRKLISLACSFNSNFNQFLASHDSRILPKLKTGIVQQPIDNVYWQKECGAFEAENLWGRQDDALDVISLEGDDLKPNCFATGGYEENSGQFSHDLYVEDGLGRRYIVKPRPDCLMYVGEWSYIETNKDVQNKERWYWNSIQHLANHLFESALNNNPVYNLFSHNVSRVHLHDCFQGSHDDEWLLKIFLLRVISGALDMYADPLKENSEPHLQKRRQALEASLGTLISPNEATAKAAKRLIRHIKASGAEIDWMGKLEDVADQKAYLTINKTSPLKALVREISLLSKMLLNTSNSHAGRFPTSAIQNILELVDEDVTDESIRRYQEQYDDSDEKYLSSGHLGDSPF